MEETGPTSIVANWSTPAEPNGILLHYNVYLEREEETGFMMIGMRQIPAVEGMDDYSTSFNNLLAFTLYRVHVSAETRIGEGPSVSDFVNTDPDGASPPTNVAAETINSTAIRVSWSYPEIPRGNITGYHIFHNIIQDGQTTINLSTINDMSDQTYVFGGLDPFTYYQFQVVAFAETPELTHFGDPSDPVVEQTSEDSKIHFALYYFFCFPAYYILCYLWMEETYYTVSVHLCIILVALYFPTVPTQPRNFNINSVTGQPQQLMATWTQPDPPNGIITAYTITCTLSTQQVCTYVCCDAFTIPLSPIHHCHHVHM